MHRLNHADRIFRVLWKVGIESLSDRYRMENRTVNHVDPFDRPVRPPHLPPMCSEQHVSSCRHDVSEQSLSVSFPRVPTASGGDGCIHRDGMLNAIIGLFQANRTAMVGACNHQAPSISILLCNPPRCGHNSCRTWCLGAQTLSFCATLLPSFTEVIWVIFDGRKLMLPCLARCP